ncbi:calcineurin regulatory subunit B, putative (macronuclear) [Tetrahymena thermophila SB210]|uniref:Calcineurin regulatory subunit B, putative n=1 Tax=Tetrahymena thermophila (strain SB210) TaxID=312017 RepID=I7M453_TETTS|nr:calcineurin regulatory subunit B, putative [Tetrahymena thermophila SB210]EAS04926.2 calcineurin regulatory subunit B, putative [Tetrahymena thermophila SB210]|eukprot:XP_001025171.2 calcineurin regulatory subunit B, putative [Tetrahymena thermophila SB210]
MGNTVGLTPLEVQQISQCTNFDEKDVRKIFRKYQKLDKVSKGNVNYFDMQRLPEISQNPLGERVAKSLSHSQINPSVDFTTFISNLNTFNSNNQEAKIKFYFKVYDTDEDGVISKQDVENVFSLLVNNEIKKFQLKDIIDTLFSQYKLKNENYFDYQEFKSLVLQMQEQM